MINIVRAAVVELQAQGGPEPVYAHRRWDDPSPGSAVIVVTLSDDWAPMATTAQAPTIKALIYAAPSAGQDDAEAIALAVADKVRSVLHRPQHGAPTWGELRIISSMHVGSGLADVEGHPGWALRTLTFEVEVA